MNTKVLASLFVLTLSLAPAAAEAGRGGHEGPGGPGRGHERMMEKLNLSDAQKAKLKEIREAGEKKLQEAHEKIKASREKLRTAMAGDTSSDELRRIHKEMQDQHRALGDLRFEQMLAIREVLTPEQRRKFGEMKGERFGKFGRKGKKGRHLRHGGPGAEDVED